ncbi:hypothetical protein HanHA89_Chr01g0001041 [Helianthus annuus]|nr:hypothetical protein HanHA89_Chr01g0001041 [Helianthus annuus]
MLTDRKGLGIRSVSLSSVQKNIKAPNWSSSSFELTTTSTTLTSRPPDLRHRSTFTTDRRPTITCHHTTDHQPPRPATIPPITGHLNHRSPPPLIHQPTTDPPSSAISTAAPNRLPLRAASTPASRRQSGMASSSSAQPSRKRGRLSRTPVPQPPPERPARVIRYSEDPHMPDPFAVPPPPADLPLEETHTLLQFHPDSDEYAALQRHLGLRYHQARVLDWDLMDRMGVRARFEGLITPRWRRLLDERRAYHHELVLEFHATFRLHHVRFAEPAAVSFALGRRTHILSLAQFAVHTGLYTLEETTQPIFTESLMGWTDETLPQCVTTTQLTAFWSTIGDGEWGSGIPASQIRDPVIRFLHRILACTVLSRYMSLEKVTYHDQFTLYCMVEGHEANLAVFLLHAFDRARGRGADSRICMGSYISVLAESLGVYQDFPPGWLHEEPVGSLYMLSDMRQMIQLLAPGDPPRFLEPRAVQLVIGAGGEAQEEAPVAAPRHRHGDRERARVRGAGAPRAARTVEDRLDSLEQSVAEVRTMLQRIIDHLQIPPQDQPHSPGQQ